MEGMEVRIVKLEPMRVAYATAFGAEPEMMAWNVLRGWAKEKGLLARPQEPRCFGFNNPDPTPGSPNYGYEVWMEVAQDQAVEPPVQVKQVEGGVYAVTRAVGVAAIYDTWQKLVAWVETSPYTPVWNRQCLEEHIRVFDVPLEELTLDLYMPVREA